MNLKLRTQFNNHSFNDIYNSSKLEYIIFPHKYHYIYNFCYKREYEYHLKKIREIFNEKSPYNLIPLNDPFAISNSKAQQLSRDSKNKGFFYE